MRRPARSTQTPCLTQDELANLRDPKQAGCMRTLTAFALLLLIGLLGGCQKQKDSAEVSQAEAPTGMLWIPGGEFSMGSEGGQPNETPVHTVRVSGFWMDETEVTNAQFREFVEATGHVTQGEKSFSAEEYPYAPP